MPRWRGTAAPPRRPPAAAAARRPRRRRARVPSAGSDVGDLGNLARASDRPPPLRFPPVARHAAAVAAAGRIEHDQRQDERPVRHLRQPDERRRGERGFVGHQRGCSDGMAAACRLSTGQHDERRRGCCRRASRSNGAGSQRQPGRRGTIAGGDLRAWRGRRPRRGDARSVSGPPRPELGVHERVQRAVELRDVGRAIHHRQVVRSRPSSASRRAAPSRARRTACPAADTTPTRRCRRAGSRAPSAASARCPRASRPDSRTAGRSRPRCRPRAARRAASAICSTRVPFSIASRIRCDARLGADPGRPAAGGAQRPRRPRR